MGGFQRKEAPDLSVTDVPGVCAAALGVLSPHSSVAVRLEGVPAIVAFELDTVEDHRRRELGVQAITSRALLHALWLLPEGGWVDSGSLPDHKADLLAREPAVVRQRASGFFRTYVPAGRVHAIGFSSGSLQRALRQALRHPPTVRRYAVISSSRSLSSTSLAEAREWEVGVIVHGENAAAVLVPPGVPEIGIPSVYRWWLIESAYEAFCQASAQADS